MSELNNAKTVTFNLILVREICTSVDQYQHIELSLNIPIIPGMRFNLGCHLHIHMYKKELF